MAWSLSSTVKTVFGNKKILIIKGTIASGDTTASVVTGLSAIDFVSAQITDIADKTVQHSVSGGTISLTFTNPAATKIVEMFIIGH
jgi:hypoxanthine-guanine phosphoribosyltransferase